MLAAGLVQEAWSLDAIARAANLRLGGRDIKESLVRGLDPLVYLKISQDQISHRRALFILKTCREDVKVWVQSPI
jgi:hypothetical protein